MVTEDKIIDTVMLRSRLGTFLIWLGVFTWAPFILLRATGSKLPFLWFLPFHLIGVIGGSRIRSMARRELGMPPPKRNLLHTAGHILILLGISVWAPYLYSKMVMGQPVDVMDYLPYHLAGVLGGVSLHILSYMLGRYKRRSGLPGVT